MASLLFYHNILSQLIMNNFFRLVFTSIFTFLIHFFIYFGFANQYSSTSLVLSNFQDQYTSGVYQFRFLSTKAVLYLRDYLTSYDLGFLNSLEFMAKGADAYLYLSLFLFNTFFGVLTILFFNLILNTQKKLKSNEKLLIILFSSIMIGFSQFVIVPYDGLAYFLLTSFLFFFLRYLKRLHEKRNYIILLLLIIVGTLNRETMALSLSLAASLLLSERGFGKDSIYPLLGLVVAFLATYAGLRFYFHTTVTNDGVLLAYNFKKVKNLIALALEVSLLCIPFMITPGQEQRKFIGLFYFFSLPYLAFCFVTGILFEVRLFIPLFLIAMLLSSISMKNRL
ncbi:hypothetical protein [Elizabethkingia sp. JS20170427COW]|uniref:hypothetical protein n=1 Tax=Elizabethkingia sp. JS20170427COW TaxID=2583851 RepID=UPI00143DFD53|nr:hypothetical protein [Elizabethkingia sp. JS20170427COW]